MSRFTYLVGFVVLLHTSCSYEPTPEEQQAIVDKHNSLRRGVSPTASNMLKMSWNIKAASTAQTHADGCRMARSSRNRRPRYGENLYMSASVEKPWDEAIQSWYDEVKDYQYGVGSVNGGVIGHYTQVVWYRSNEIGCAMAECPNSKYKYFYVCHYSPVRNSDTHPYTEGTPCADCPDSCDDGLCTNPCPRQDKYSNCPSLKEKYGCSHPTIASRCPATCKCTNEII